MWPEGACWWRPGLAQSVFAMHCLSACRSTPRLTEVLPTIVGGQSAWRAKRHGHRGQRSQTNAWPLLLTFFSCRPQFSSAAGQGSGSPRRQPWQVDPVGDLKNCFTGAPCVCCGECRSWSVSTRTFATSLGCARYAVRQFGWDFFRGQPESSITEEPCCLDRLLPTKTHAAGPVHHLQ